MILELLGNRRVAVLKVIGIFLCSVAFGLFLVFLFGCSSTMYIKQKSYHEGYNKGFDDGSKHVLSCMGETKLKEYSKGFEEGYRQGLKTVVPAKINNIPDVKEDERDRQK